MLVDVMLVISALQIAAGEAADRAEREAGGVDDTDSAPKKKVVYGKKKPGKADKKEPAGAAAGTELSLLDVFT